MFKREEFHWKSKPPCSKPNSQNSSVGTTMNGLSILSTALVLSQQVYFLAGLASNLARIRASNSAFSIAYMGGEMLHELVATLLLSSSIGHSRLPLPDHLRQLAQSRRLCQHVVKDGRRHHPVRIPHHCRHRAVPNLTILSRYHIFRHIISEFGRVHARGKVLVHRVSLDVFLNGGITRARGQVEFRHVLFETCLDDTGMHGDDAYAKGLQLEAESLARSRHGGFGSTVES